MSVFGGKLADLPKPHRRFYDDKRRKRPVRISVIVYSIGKHYWTTLHEEDNPIWDEKEQDWRTCWDDAAARGRIQSKRCNSLVESGRWVRHMKNLVFKNHKLQHDAMDSEVRKHFVYPEHD